MKGEGCDWPWEGTIYLEKHLLIGPWPFSNLSFVNLDQLRAYCLAKPGVEESLPFGPDVLVFKVAGKMFLLCMLDTDILQFNVKCDPELVEELRERHACVQPGYHMNKKHWNTVEIDGTVSPKLVFQWIDDSYNLVFQSLPKSKRAKNKN